MVVSSGKKAVFNQAMLYNIRKPVTVLKDEQMMTIWQVHDGANVSATRSYSLCLNTNEVKMKVGL